MSNMWNFYNCMVIKFELIMLICFDMMANKFMYLYFVFPIFNLLSYHHHKLITLSSLTWKKKKSGFEMGLGTWHVASTLLVCSWGGDDSGIYMLSKMMNFNILSCWWRMGYPYPHYLLHYFMKLHFPSSFWSIFFPPFCAFELFNYLLFSLIIDP